MAINISAVEFRSEGFIEGIRQVLEENRLEPGHLEIELTESVHMRDAESRTDVLQALKATGVQLAIDDFGTGYSSLSYLKRFPIDTLKIDQSFVHDIASNPDGTTIVSAVIAMGNSLHKRVSAEGVETQAQLLSCGPSIVARRKITISVGRWLRRSTPNYLEPEYQGHPAISGWADVPRV